MAHHTHLKKPKNIQEFFVQSAMVRSRALTDRITELEKVIRPNSCAICYVLATDSWYFRKCACGYVYCSSHRLCVWASGNTYICIKCRPDLKGTCSVHLDTAETDTSDVLVFKCFICNKLMCQACTNRSHNEEVCSNCHKKEN